jgi:hypothetical protein
VAHENIWILPSSPRNLSRVSSQNTRQAGILIQWTTHNVSLLNVYHIFRPLMIVLTLHRSKTNFRWWMGKATILILLATMIWMRSLEGETQHMDKIFYCKMEIFTRKCHSFVSFLNLSVPTNIFKLYSSVSKPTNIKLYSSFWAGYWWIYGLSDLTLTGPIYSSVQQH